MVGQFYDNIWIYYKDVTEKYNADNRLENGISKDIVADAIRDFGIKLYQNNFSNEDLYTAFLGLTPGGALFPFPNITGSLPTPSGFEYVDTLISASNDYMPLDDVNKSLYKRIYHNLPYLLKAKGTLPALRTLITSYGIPDTVLRITEFGGKDKVNTNDWDYWQDTFNYAYFNTGSNISEVFGGGVIREYVYDNNFSFEDFYSQLQQIKKMGNIKDLMGMVPGMGQAVKDVDISNDSFKPIEAIIQSMTLKERQNPDLLNSSRKIRIAKGSGTSIQQVNNLMKQFEDMRKMMKMMNKVQDGKMKMPNMGNMLKR